MPELWTTRDLGPYIAIVVVSGEVVRSQVLRIQTQASLESSFILHKNTKGSTSVVGDCNRNCGSLVILNSVINVVWDFAAATN